MEETPTGRELTYDEMTVRFAITILALDVPMCVRRDLIANVLDLSYKHEQDLFTARRENEQPVR
ncbi:MAG: hypothetical protein J6V08_02940 [Candidatus Methanomethylophilaceae archaeon]|nr:hypothetical protein [Candidatus Methanomethylophilaceae archaeon]